MQMNILETPLGIGYVNPKTERGKAREEHYSGAGRPKEPFGINKRTRRLKKGEVCSLPNGTWSK